MYSDTFLTVCPACKTVESKLQLYLNKEVLCTGCLSIFTAQEKYIYVEENFKSHLTPVKETEGYSKGLQEGRTTTGSNEECNDHNRLTSPINNARGENTVHKEAMEKFPAKGLEVEAERQWAPSKIILSDQKEERVMESERQRINEECADRIKETKGCHNDKSGKLAVKLSMKERGISKESEGGQGGAKSRKRKYSHNLGSWGVALRKPSREKKKVRSYSPSREWNFKKRTKLGLKNGGKVGQCDRTVVKKKQKNRGEVRKNSGKIKENSFSSGNGDVSKGGKTAPDGTTDEFVKTDPEGYPDEFKQFLTGEIQRQILDGLGDGGKKALGELQVVDVEEIRPCTANKSSDLRDAVPADQQYIAKVKLMATLFFPVTLRGSQGPPEGFCEHMEHHQAQPPSGLEREESKVIEKPQSDESKGREATKDESNGREATKEPECPGLMEPEQVSDEPLFQNGNSEEVEVPESEFYDFDCYRSEDKFDAGQVWASYDSGKDMMPRDYIQIKKVMSINPFKAQIAVLEPEGFSEWVKAGNSLTCGEFRTENTLRVMDHIDFFSHNMKWEKGQNGVICIYPAERDVWALYKNWTEIDASRRTKFGYEIVKVVAVKEDLTISVVPLVNYKGSQTLFLPQKMKPFQIHKRDFVRFSHQIPTYEILGAQDLEGCVELDPAATPY